MFLFSGIGTIVNIRNTTKYPHKFPIFVIWSYSIIFILTMTVGLMCFTAFGDQHLQKNMLYYFDDQKFFWLLNLIFNLVISCWYPFLIVSTLEQIEYFEFYKKWLNKEKYWSSKCKVRSTRIIGGILIIILTFVTDDIIVAESFCGEVILPVCTVLIPLWLLHSKAVFLDKKRKSVLQILHDFIMFSICLAIVVISLYKFLIE